LLLAVTGALTVLLFAADTIIALVIRKPFSLGFWSWMAALETAAWHLKWAVIPMSLLVAFGSRKLYRSIQQAPDNFCALRFARNGYIASAAVPLLVLLLIGITIPARLRHRSWGTEAARNSYILRFDRALRDYREANEGLPSDVKPLTSMPDPDGTLAEALTNLDVSGYRPSANLAAVPSRKPQQLRGAVIRNASISSADEPIGERLSFTNYELPLPGDDKITGTEDDLLVRDGVVYKVSELPHRGVENASVTKPRPR
jgi:hypothetical protein